VREVQGAFKIAEEALQLERGALKIAEDALEIERRGLREARNVAQSAEAKAVAALAEVSNIPNIKVIYICEYMYNLVCIYV